MNACTHSCDPSPDMQEVWKRSLIRVTDEFTLPPVVLRVDDAIIGTLGNFSVSTGKAKAKSPDQADGKRFGDFEMDLIVDSHNHAILTIVERSTNMLFITKLAHGKKSEPLAKAVRRLLLPYKKYIKTITTDNCPEFTAHKLITKYLGAVVYFADSYASWQKGAIENANKLIRQYIPKQANFDDFTDKKIASIQKKINSRPRQKLRFEIPKAEFFKRIA